MTTHIGSRGCLCRAQETVYWPGMNAKITDYIQKCDVCMSLQKNHSKEPLICHEPTSRPWEKVATDIIHTWWQELSVHSNYYSGYFEVDQLHGKTGTVIIKKLKKHFVTHGTPNEFENFLRSSGTAYVTSSPGYPQSNGRVMSVKTAKSLIKEVKAMAADYFLLLLSWRNTPTEGLSTSPQLGVWALAIGERQDSQTNATSHDKSQTWFKAEIEELAETADIFAGAESHSTAHNLARLL